jgi:RNA polymerase sigma-70 factor (ECF subfamily)
MAARTAGRLPADEIVVARLLERDEEMFAAVLNAWSPGMLRVALGFVASVASAEDVVQETWIVVLRGLPGFEGRAALRTWVYRILANIAQRCGAAESRAVPLASPQPDPTVPQPWPFPEESALAAEVRAEIGSAVAALPTRLRVVITLRDVAGYRSDEVCSLLEITPGNQRVLLHRARAAVRGSVEAYLGAAPHGNAVELRRTRGLGSEALATRQYGGWADGGDRMVRGSA